MKCSVVQVEKLTIFGAEGRKKDLTSVKQSLDKCSGRGFLISTSSCNVDVDPNRPRWNASCQRRIEHGSCLFMI